MRWLRPSLNGHGNDVDAVVLLVAHIRGVVPEQTERHFVLIGEGGQTTEVGETVTTKVGFADHVLRCAAERPAVMGAAVMQWSR